MTYVFLILKARSYNFLIILNHILLDIPKVLDGVFPFLTCSNSILYTNPGSFVPGSFVPRKFCPRKFRPRNIRSWNIRSILILLFSSITKITIY